MKFQSYCIWTFLRPHVCSGQKNKLVEVGGGELKSFNTITASADTSDRFFKMQLKL